jgi:hypothetical protein
LPDITEKLQDKQKTIPPLFPNPQNKKIKKKNNQETNQKINSQAGAEGLYLEDQKSTKSGYAGSMQTHQPPTHDITQFVVA